MLQIFLQLFSKYFFDTIFLLCSFMPQRTHIRTRTHIHTKQIILLEAFIVENAPTTQRTKNALFVRLQFLIKDFFKIIW